MHPDSIREMGRRGKLKCVKIGKRGSGSDVPISTSGSKRITSARELVATRRTVAEGVGYHESDRSFEFYFRVVRR